jgi:hypothetical protein
MGRGTSKKSGGGLTIHDVMLNRKSNPKWKKGRNMAAEGFARRQAKKGK